MPQLTVVVMHLDYTQALLESELRLAGSTHLCLARRLLRRGARRRMRRRVLSFERRTAMPVSPVQVPPVQVSHNDFQPDPAPAPVSPSAHLPPILPTADVQLGRQIGTGSYKYVYEAKVPHLGTVAALRFRRQDRTGWPREAVALMMLKDSPFVTTLLAASEDPDHRGWMLLMEIATLGPLDALLESCSDRLHLRHQVSMAHQIARAVVAVAAAGFAHADLAARNVLVCEMSERGCRVKLADFGSCVRLDRGGEENSQLSQRPLATRWAPPEVSEGPLYSCNTLSPSRPRPRPRPHRHPHINRTPGSQREASLLRSDRCLVFRRARLGDLLVGRGAVR